MTENNHIKIIVDKRGKIFFERSIDEWPLKIDLLNGKHSMRDDSSAAWLLAGATMRRDTATTAVAKYIFKCWLFETPVSR